MAAPTRAQLLDALRRADAAGDAPAARAIARRLSGTNFSNVVGGADTVAEGRYTPEQLAAQARRQAMSPQQREAAAQTSADAYQSQVDALNTRMGIVRGLGVPAKAAVEGVTGTLDFFGTPLRAGIEAGTGLPQQTLTQAVGGVIDPESRLAPQGFLEQRAADLAAGTTGALAFGGGGAGLARQVAPRLPGIGAEVAQSVGRLLAANPEAIAITGAAGGGSSGIARDMGAGPVGQFAAGLLGGGLPALAASAGRNMPSILQNVAERGLRKEFQNVRPEQLRTGTGQVDYPQTPAEASPDFSRLQMEQFSRQQPAAAPEFARTAERQAGAVKDTVQGLAGTPAARAAAVAERDQVFGVLRDAAGKQIGHARGSLGEALKTTPVNTRGLKQSIAAFKTDERFGTDDAQAVLNKVEKRIQGYEKALGTKDQITAAQLRAEYSRLNTYLRQATESATGKPTAVSNEGKSLVSEMGEYVAGVLDRAVPGTRDALTRYGELSRPINVMDDARGILARGKEGGSIGQGEIKRLLKNDRLQNNARLTPEARQTLEDLNEAMLGTRASRKPIASQKDTAQAPVSSSSIQRLLTATGSLAGKPGVTAGLLAAALERLGAREIMRKQAPFRADATRLAGLLEQAAPSPGLSPVVADLPFAGLLAPTPETQFRGFPYTYTPEDQGY